MLTKRTEMDWSFLNRQTLTTIFVVAVMIGLAHYAITGFKDFAASCYVALHAGWGALAFDIVFTLQSRFLSSSRDKS
jgi:hypothetical protein